MIRRAKNAVRSLLRKLGYELVGIRDYDILQRKITALREHLALLESSRRHEQDREVSDESARERDAQVLAEQAEQQRYVTSIQSGNQANTHRARRKPEAVDSDSRFWPPRYPFPHLAGVQAMGMEIRIVDVGAEVLEFEDDVYAPLTREAVCEVVAFDPFADSTQPPDSTPAGAGVAAKRVLPYFIGDGRDAIFHLNQFSPTSSLFPTNEALASQFLNLAQLCRTTRSWPVKTRRLDDLPEIGRCDFLKVDVQGGDYDVIAGGEQLLGRTLFVHIEVEFAELYLGQKLFPDIDCFLRAQGFELIDLVKLGWNNYRAMPSVLLRSRLLWADAIYMKRTDRISEMDDPALLRAAFIAHVNYRKYDLAAHLLAAYDKRAGSALLPAYTASFID